jgi:flagellar basal-body rod modification protein FlgD
MVGQMISLNQLEQLIGINQTITGVSSSSSTPTTNAAQAAGTSIGTTPAAASTGASSALSPLASTAATGQLPFNPNTMMPLGFGNSGATAASINSSLNPATMGLSGSNDSTSGGK